MINTEPCWLYITMMNIHKYERHSLQYSDASCYRIPVGKMRYYSDSHGRFQIRAQVLTPRTRFWRFSQTNFTIHAWCPRGDPTLGGCFWWIWKVCRVMSKLLNINPHRVITNFKGLSCIHEYIYKGQPCIQWRPIKFTSGLTLTGGHIWCRYINSEIASLFYC